MATPFMENTGKNNLDCCCLGQLQNNIGYSNDSVVDPDGVLRTVKYTADKKNGFQAEVITSGKSNGGGGGGGGHGGGGNGGGDGGHEESGHLE